MQNVFCIQGTNVLFEYFILQELKTNKKITNGDINEENRFFKTLVNILIIHIYCCYTSN